MSLVSAETCHETTHPIPNNNKSKINILAKAARALGILFRSIQRQKGKKTVANTAAMAKGTKILLAKYKAAKMKNRINNFITIAEDLLFIIFPFFHQIQVSVSSLARASELLFAKIPYS
jgi:hypothetical protein